MHVYVLCTGYIELDRASMVSDLKPGQPWTVPVTSFLVDHPRGRLLFDTGVHCQARIDPLTRLGPERIKRLTVKSQVGDDRSEEHTSELQSRLHLVCRLLLEKKKKNNRVLNLSK